MFVTSVRVGKTFNMGNFESERIDVEVSATMFTNACGDRVPVETAAQLHAEALRQIEAMRTPVATIAAVRKLKSAGLSNDDLATLGIKIPPGA